VPVPPPKHPPPLRAPELWRPVPRFLPGVDAPALRQHGAEGAAWASVPRPDDPAWLHGLDLFDQQAFWEAHEWLEALWRPLPRRSVEAVVAQGLILGGAAALKQHRGDLASTARLLARIRARWAPVGGVVLGVALIASLEGWERGDWRVVGG
jgi:hypothetical protein